MSEIESEVAASDRPEWLPANFKSAEDMATSYAEAQRKITSQGQQLSDLRSQLEDQSPLPEANDENDLWSALAQYPDQLRQMEELANQAHSGEDPNFLAHLSHDQQLEAIVASTVRNVDARYGRAPDQLSGDAVIGYAGQAVGQSIEGFDTPEVQEQIANVIAANPELAQRANWAIQNGNIEELGRVILDSAPNSAIALDMKSRQLAAREADLSDRNKMQAQSAVGAGPGRSQASGSSEDWGAIVRAGNSSPWTSGMRG